MKKLKNKQFYINVFFIYIFMLIAFYILSKFFIVPEGNSFIIKHFAASQKPSSDIILIVDDDKADEEFGTTGYNRYNIILKYLTYTNPKIIGIDLVPSFDILDPNDVDFAKQISKMPNVVLGFTPKSIEAEGDNIAFSNEFAKKYALKTSNNKNGSYYYNTTGMKNNFVIDYANNLGFVNVDLKKDILYSTYGLLNINGYYYPSLPLKMYMMLNNTNSIELKNNSAYIPKTKLTLPFISDKKQGTKKYNIRYYKTSEGNNFSHLSITARAILSTYNALESGITPENNPKLYDFMTGEYLDPALFNDKIVLIGEYKSSKSHNTDVFKTPMNAAHPGVDIQASVLDNFINKCFLKYIPEWLNIIMACLMSILAFIFILRYKFLKGLLTTLGIDTIYLSSIFAFAYFGGYIFDYSTVIVLQTITSMFAYSFKFISENRNKEKIKLAMGKYLSQDIMKNVVKNIDDLKLGGKRAIVTVLFSDIRGFTSLSEKLPAEEVSMILNEYFTEMEPIITKYNGVINKFIGDAVMAIFGEPIQDINHAKNAVKCAYEMLKKVEYLREKWLNEGKPKIEIGIGINTGEVFIGNIGTETRMEYTVIGDTVNLASRIEHYNKVYKTNLLISSSTYSHISSIADVIKINEVQIRGKKNKMNIYEVLRIDKNG